MRTKLKGTFKTPNGDAIRVRNTSAIKPYPVIISSGTTEIWGGPCRLKRVTVGGNSTGSAVTLTLRDTTGGHPTTGGRAIRTIIIPLSSGALPPFEMDEICSNGLVATLSATGCVVTVEIEGINPEAPLFNQSDGSFIYRGNLVGSATTRVDSNALNTDTQYIREGSSSLKVLAANPAGPIVVEWNQGTQTGVSSIEPTMLFRNAVVQVYVKSPCQTYNNGTKGPNANMTCYLRVFDSAYTNGFSTVEYPLSPGWNRIVMPRQDFSTAAGSPSWATTSFTRYELRFDAGTSTSPNIEVYIDSIAINCTPEGPIPVMVDFDDGWDINGGITDLLAKFPSFKANLFLVKDFSSSQLSTYSTKTELAAFRDKYRDRVYLGWHSVTHSGPTSLEALTQAAFTAAEIAPWIPWFGYGGELHGVTPNGQDSAAMRAAFVANGFVSNRTVRHGHNHPWHMAQQAMLDLRAVSVAGSFTYPTDWDNMLVGLSQTGCMPVFLFHGVGWEDSGTPIGGVGSTLNLLPSEIDHIGRTLQGLSDAGLIKMLTRPEMMIHMKGRTAAAAARS